MDDTEFFLPSEIARLVYGHCKAIGCHEVSSKFLSESSDLSECRELQKRNRTFKTEANGLTLKEILDQYLNMNKLILGTVNKLTGDPQKFREPAEALNYLLSDVSKEDLSCTNVDMENQHSPAHSSTSSEDVFSDFSLTLKTPEKSKQCEKFTANKLETVVELNQTIDRSTQETTPASNKVPPKPSIDTVIRQSTRLQLKKALKNDRSCNSDSIKELRKNPNEDCETPRKVGNPPYSENKLLKPKNSIGLLSSDSEPEICPESALTVVNSASSISSATSERLNGLFSPERAKPATIKKKTLKVMKPRRPPPSLTSSIDLTSDSDKIKCKRNRASTSHSTNNFADDSKKSKLSDDISELPKSSNGEEKKQMSVDESVFITDASEVTDKQKVRRRSGSAIPANDDRINSMKLNKSLPVIDDIVLEEKWIRDKKLHERIAANINEVITNSPQKNFSEAGIGEKEEMVKKTVEKITKNDIFDELLNDLFGGHDFTQGFVTEQVPSNINPETDFQENPLTAAVNINDQTPINNQVTVGDIENSTVDNNDDVESHNGEQNAAIIIELRTDQMVDQESYVGKNGETSGGLRNYWSNPGIESSPDAKLVTAKSDNASVINVITSDGEISESCKIGGDTSGRLFLNSSSVLLESIPYVTFTKNSDFQICGTPSSISHVRRSRLVPIAPKPPQLPEEVSSNNERIKIPKKRRTRGGKRA